MYTIVKIKGYQTPGTAYIRATRTIYASAFAQLLKDISYLELKIFRVKLITIVEPNIKICLFAVPPSQKNFSTILYHNKAKKRVDIPL